MSLAATQDYQPHESLMVPDGGIAAFLNATEGDWATDDIPRTGIAQVKHVADRLAEYGRHEDEFMVHAAEGETVVPLEVLNANPQLKNNLFKQMEAMGLEPERYVVGNELNSLNPVTGQPEFFLKKLFKGVKKLVKKVVKVIKKAVPIILPIALAMTPLGPIFGAAMGSGINTLAAGGDFKDALKAGIKAGAIGGFASGIAGGVGSIRAGNTFAEGFKSSVGNAAGGIGERFKQFASPGRVSEAGGSYFGDPTRAITSPDQARALQLSQNLPPNLDLSRGKVTVSDVPKVAPASNVPYDPNQLMNTRITGSGVPGIGISTNNVDPSTLGIGNIQTMTPEAANNVIANMNATPYTGTAPYGGAADAAAERSLLQKTGDYMFRGGQSKDALLSAQELAAKNAGELYMANTPINLQSSAAFEAKKAAARAALAPGKLARFGPSAALASGIAAGTGFFDVPEIEETEEEKMLTGEELLAADPDKYLIRYPSASPVYNLTDVSVPGYGAIPSYGRLPGYGTTQTGYASGGDVDTSQFPRQNGAIAGPGTGRSDDVPAMLSDGEFVMTARAVRGAGNGDRNNGMQTMYNLMRNFEAAR